MFAARPTAGAALTVGQLLLGPANAALARLRLFRVLDPTDELVAGQGGDVFPFSQPSGGRSIYLTGGTGSQITNCNFHDNKSPLEIAASAGTDNVIGPNNTFQERASAPDIGYWESP